MSVNPALVLFSLAVLAALSAEVVMRYFWSLLIVVGLACAGFAWAESNKQAKSTGSRAAVAADAESRAADNGVAQADSFIVHEWGTFTGVTGSDGAQLEFRPLVHNDLPEFVVNRAWQAGRAPSPFLKWSIQSFQRMETPITYFYTDRERDVEVKVGFPKGLLTEFYPPVASMTPDFDFNKRAAIGNSELNWGRITLIPPERFLPALSDPQTARAAQQRILEALPPFSEAHPHYRFARQADSAIVHVRRPGVEGRPYTPSGDFFERFLFYRGVGNFTLPLSVVARGAGSFEVSNSGDLPIRSLFLVTVRDDQLFVQSSPEVPATGRIKMKEPANPTRVYELAQQVTSALIAAGLYQKEAEAMVATWSGSWFTEPGTRLFYLLPERMTDELLPLTISPRPDKTVRVMVGRLEIISPDEEARIHQIVATSRQNRAAAAAAAANTDAKTEPMTKTDAGDPAAGAARTEPSLPEALINMGRLAEPALIRLYHFSKDEAVRNEAAVLLGELHRFQQAEIAKSAP